MSENDSTTTNVFNVTDLPPQAQEGIEKAQSFYELNKSAVRGAIAGILLYKGQKMLIKKVVTQVIRKELPKILESEIVGLTLNDKFGVIGTIAKAAKP